MVPNRRKQQNDCKKKQYYRDPEAERAKRLKKNFGITPGDYEKMLEAQHGVCAICFQSEVSIDSRNGLQRKLAIDHDHVTEKIRELLCSRCNLTVGLVKEDTSILLSAVTYLEKYRK